MVIRTVGGFIRRRGGHCWRVWVRHTYPVRIVGVEHVVGDPSVGQVRKATLVAARIVGHLTVCVCPRVQGW